MTGLEPFEYALIRVVPRVERGEAMNVGVILYSQRHAYLDCRIRLDENRLRALDPSVDLPAVTAALNALGTECRRAAPGGGSPASPASRASRGARFRWLTATRSTVVQPGPVHSGLTTDPAAELEHLFDTLVR